MLFLCSFYSVLFTCSNRGFSNTGVVFPVLSLQVSCSLEQKKVIACLFPVVIVVDTQVWTSRKEMKWSPWGIICTPLTLMFKQDRQEWEEDSMEKTFQDGSVSISHSPWVSFFVARLPLYFEREPMAKRLLEVREILWSKTGPVLLTLLLLLFYFDRSNKISSREGKEWIESIEEEMGEKRFTLSHSFKEKGAQDAFFFLVVSKKKSLFVAPVKVKDNPVSVAQHWLSSRK